MKDSRFKDCNAGSANSEHLHEMSGPQEGQPGVRSFVRSSDPCFMAPSTGLGVVQTHVDSQKWPYTRSSLQYSDLYPKSAKA